LVSFPSVIESALGLSGGTLYDVLQVNGGIGNSTVNATGFSINCGYLEDVVASYDSSSDAWLILPQGGGSSSVQYYIYPTREVFYRSLRELLAHIIYSPRYDLFKLFTVQHLSLAIQHHPNRRFGWQYFTANKP
jgi:hypothetical protein